MHSSKHFEVAAESSVKTQVKTKASSLVVTAPSPPPARGAAPRSPTSCESKRRKLHTTKPTPGQNVASATCSLFMEIKLNDYRKITKKEIIKLAYHLESKMLWNQIPWKEHLCNKTLICQTPEDK
jgi:hypothetical protein